MSNEDYDPDKDYNGARGHSAADALYKNRGGSVFRSDRKTDYSEKQSYNPVKPPENEMTADEVIEETRRKLSETPESKPELRKSYESLIRTLETEKARQQRNS